MTKRRRTYRAGSKEYVDGTKKCVDTTCWVDSWWVVKFGDAYQ